MLLLNGNWGQQRCFVATRGIMIQDYIHFTLNHNIYRSFLFINHNHFSCKIIFYSIKLIRVNFISIYLRRSDASSSFENVEEGFTCPSVIKYARPQLARAASGIWKYIINTGEHTQTLRMEKCS